MLRYYIPMDFIGEWFGGKPGGGLNRHNAGWIVRFQNPYEGKCFSDSSYGDEREAHDAAVAWRVTESNRRNQTRNLMRAVRTAGELYLEVQLQDGRVMKCDLDDSAFASERTWSSWQNKTGQDVYYACWSGRKNDYGVRFHQVLCPQWIVVDHINRDGLDNRRANLRDGVNGVNARNMGKRADNSSGVTGVSYSENSNAWVVQWSENGRRRMKRFKGARDDDAAKQQAIEFRQRVNVRTNTTNGET
jgi:hypothetical protein